MSVGVAVLVTLAALLWHESREPTRRTAPAPLVSVEDQHGRTARDGMSHTLRGYVRNEWGAPIAGAAVAATVERLEVTERAQCATGADGGFVMQVADTSSTFRLQVVADCYFAAFVDALVPGAPPSTVTLRAAPSLKGTVLTSAGDGVAGARVRLLARTRFGEASMIETTSDAKGDYRLSAGLLDLVHLETPLLEASAMGFAPTRVELRDFAALLASGPALHELQRDIVLSRGQRLTGHVRDETGAPVSGAELVVYTHAGRGILTDPYGTTRSSELGPTAIAATRSAADGSFVLERLPVRSLEDVPKQEQDLLRGSYHEEAMGSIRVRAEGFALGGAHLPWTKESEPPPPLELVLVRSAVFTGRAVDGQGRALEGAEIMMRLDGVRLDTIVPYGTLPDGFGELVVWSRAPERPPTQGRESSYSRIRSGADGRFRSPALPCIHGDNAQVRLELSWRGERGAWQAFELRAGEQRELGAIALALRDVQGPIEGVVQGPDGEPVAGAEVRLRDHWMCRTDRGGRFRFEHAVLPEAAFARLDVKVRARGFARHHVVLTERPQGPLEVQLTKGHELRGTLTFTNGSPAANGRIALEPLREPSQGFWSALIDPARADAAGRFTLTDLPEPPWLVSYLLERQGERLSGDTLVHVPRTDLALELPRFLHAFTSLELVVTDIAGRTIAVKSAPQLVGGPNRIAGLRRDARTFVFPEVARGHYKLKVEAPGFVPHEEELELGTAARVDVVLQVVCRVRVRVEPLPLGSMDFRVVAEPTAGAVHGVAVGADGLAELGVLRHGSWTIGLEAHGSARGTRAWRGPTRTVDVAVGESSLEWTLERPALGRVRLTLPVLDAADAPLPSDDPSSTDSSPLARSERLQARSIAYQRSLRRARELNLELRDDADAVVLDMKPEDVELDAPRHRVLSTFTAPVGRYTLVLRRGAEVLRSTPIQVSPDTSIDLDP